MTIAALASALGSSPLWYLTRATGLLAFVLATGSVCLGIASTQRAVASPRWPRFATQSLHRNISLLAMVMLIVHIVSTIQDSYVDVGWASLLVPWTSAYETTWVGLGTIAFDLLLLVILTSALRRRLPARLWRVSHWTVYAAWPLMLVHFLKTGTDTSTWGLLLAAGCAASVAGAVAVRLSTSNTPAPLRTMAGASR